MIRYHGKARNALALTLEAPAYKRLRLRPWAVAAWLAVIGIAILSCL